MSLQYYFVNLLTFATGSSYSWSSPVVPKLLGELGTEMNPLDHTLTLDEKAWLVALVPFGAIFGCPLGGFLASKLGKRRALIISGIPMLVSYILTTFPKDIIYYYVAKFLGGISCGCCFTLVPLYVGETADKGHRGHFGCFFGIFLKMGTVFSYLVGPYVSVQVFSLLCSVPVIVFLVALCFFFPETPYHLVSTGNLKKAEKVLTKLRKPDNEAEIKIELDEITMFVKENETNSTRNVFKALSEKASLRALILGTSLLCFQQLSGIVVMISYTQTILEESGNLLRADYASSVVGIIQVILAMLTSQVIEKFGRRQPLIISTGLICVSMCTIGIYFTLKHQQVDVQSCNWIPFAGMVLYFIGYCLGIGPVVWAMMGELFDTKVKSLGASIANCMSKVSAFLPTVLFPYIAASFGMEAVFFFLSFIMLVAFFFVLFFVPETKAKSFAQIKTMLDKNFLQRLC